jgi:hypothetical protein
MPIEQALFRVLDRLTRQIISFYLNHKKSTTPLTGEALRVLTAKLWTIRKILMELQNVSDDKRVVEISSKLLTDYEKVYRIIEAEAYDYYQEEGGKAQ